MTAKLDVYHFLLYMHVSCIGTVHILSQVLTLYKTLTLLFIGHLLILIGPLFVAVTGGIFI